MFKKASESIEGKAETWLAAKASSIIEANIFAMKILYNQKEEDVAEEDLVVSTKGIHTFMLKSFDPTRQNSGDKQSQTRSTYVLFFW